MKIETACARALLLTPLPWILLVVVMGVLWTAFPRWEGSAFPVTTPFTIASRTMVNDHSQFIDVAFTKHRFCEYKSMAFYWRDADGSLFRVPWRNANAAADSGTQDTSRPVGANRVILEVDSALPLDRLMASTRHSCHPLWDTVTKIWP